MARTVITPAQLLELRTFLRESDGDCDNTHARTVEWLQRHGMTLDGETAERIKDCGGCCCDCEIAWNFPDTIEAIEARLEWWRKQRVTH